MRIRGTLRAALPVLLLTPVVAAAYSDGPPPAHTGGFGEPTCAACHLPPDPPAEGRLEIEGVPSAYRPGGRYRLAVVLEDPALERGGFELSARTPGGEQAGTLRAVDERVEVVSGEPGAVEYARQSAAGVRPGDPRRSPPRIEWRLLWIAPDGEPAPEVRFHAAANAANYDDSELGDTPYAARAVVEPAPVP